MIKRPQVNMQFFILFCVLFRTLFFSITWYTYIALIISFYQFFLLFLTIGTFIPIRSLSGLFMCVQMLVGPSFAYNGMDVFQEGYYKMQIPEAEYFNYAIPAVLVFIFGLNIKSERLQGERPNVSKIKEFVKFNESVPFVFIAVGFFAGFSINYFSSDLKFVFSVLSVFKFIGLFLIILGEKKIKPTYLIFVMGSIISTSIAQGMFFDFLTWVIFLSSIYAIKFKPSFYLKILFTIFLVFLAFIIQQLKGEYREATWVQGQQANIQTMTKALKKKDQKSGIFSLESLASANLRINQGYIITNIMKTVPEIVPFQNGDELKLILESALLPRIIAPDKLNAGDRMIFMKYTNFPVIEGTSMGLSSLGDAYINFGVIGGCLFMLFYGLIFNLFLKMIYKNSFKYPILILFSSVIFYYPMRPDCELQTILGHLLKSTFIVFVIINIWSYKFRYKKNKISYKFSEV